MRVFLDANILFSAAAFTDGAVARLVNLLRAGGHECWADIYVVTEARRNLAAKKPAALAAFVELIGNTEIASTRRIADPDTLPTEAESLSEKDRPVLAAAIGCGCEALVTGDRTHFGRLYGQAIGGVMIHSPASLTEALFPE